MAIVVIEPRYRNSTKFHFEHAGYKPGCLSNAVIYMWEEEFADYRLLINGREYEWPDGDNRLGNVLRLHGHIDHCVELDEAFYESND